MNIISGIIAVLLSTIIAFLLNKILAGQIEKRMQKLILQIVAYIICFLLAVVFIVTGNLRIIINNFIDEKIIFSIENKLDSMFPNTGLLEAEIDTTDIAATFNRLNNIMVSDNESEYDFLESIAWDVFTGKFRGYINRAEHHANRLTEIADNDGMITIKSILLHFKEQALDAIVPFFKLAQNFTILLLVIYIAIYVCIVIFLKKGGGSYNKSIVFGDGGSDLERGMDDKPI